MPDLNFEIVSAEPVAYSMLPTLNFKMRISNVFADERIQNVNLKCQVMLAVTQRRYNNTEKAKLKELFGEPERWGKTLHAFLWTNVTTIVPGFSGSTEVDLPILCSYDFEVVSTKYFDALEDGNIPLNFLFSGTIFYKNEEGSLQIAQISWAKEANYRLPVAIWKETIAMHFPNSAWLRLHKDVFDQLYHYKIAHSLITWEDVFTRLLRTSSEEVQP